MSWTAPSGHVWTTGEVVTAASMNTYIRLDLEDLDRRAAANSATVATSQTTASATFVDLATVGPTVTVTTGTTALVVVQAALTGSGGAAVAVMGFGITGATTVAASDAFAASTAAGRQCGVFPVTGLTAGSNIFTGKYRSSAGTATIADRYLAVIPWGAA